MKPSKKGYMSLEYGTVVTIKHGLRKLHSGQQGFVVASRKFFLLPDVLVWFGRECDHLIIDPTRIREIAESKDQGIDPPKAFEVCDSRIFHYRMDHFELDAHWRAVTLAKRYWPGNYHTVSEPDSPLVRSSTCEHRGCMMPAQRRAVMNVKGLVYAADFCGPCASLFDRQAIHDLPALKRINTLTENKPVLV